MSLPRCTEDKFFYHRGHGDAEVFRRDRSLVGLVRRTRLTANQPCRKCSADERTVHRTVPTFRALPARPSIFQSLESETLLSRRSHCEGGWINDEPLNTGNTRNGKRAGFGSPRENTETRSEAGAKRRQRSGKRRPKPFPLMTSAREVMKENLNKGKSIAKQA